MVAYSGFWKLFNNLYDEDRIFQQPFFQIISLFLHLFPSTLNIGSSMFNVRCWTFIFSVFNVRRSSFIFLIYCSAFGVATAFFLLVSLRVPVMTRTEAVVPTRSLTSSGTSVEVNAHRYALGQTDPLKGRADIRQQVKAGAAVVLGNAPAQAVDAAFERVYRDRS